MDNDKEANKTGVAGKRSSSKPGDSQKYGNRKTGEPTAINISILAKKADQGDKTTRNNMVSPASIVKQKLKKKRKVGEISSQKDIEGEKSKIFKKNPQTISNVPYSVLADTIQMADMLKTPEELIKFVLLNEAIKPIILNPVTKTFIAEQKELSLNQPTNLCQDSRIKISRSSHKKNTFNFKGVDGQASLAEVGDILYDISKGIDIGFLNNKPSKNKKKTSKHKVTSKKGEALKSHLLTYLPIVTYLSIKFDITDAAFGLIEILQKSKDMENFAPENMLENKTFVLEAVESILILNEDNLFKMLMMDLPDMYILISQRFNQIFIEHNRLEYLVYWFSLLRKFVESHPPSRSLLSSLKLEDESFESPQSRIGLASSRTLRHATEEKEPGLTKKRLQELIRIYFHCSDENQMIMSIFKAMQLSKVAILYLLLESGEQERLIRIVNDYDGIVEHLTEKEVLKRRQYKLFILFDAMNLINIFNMEICMDEEEPEIEVPLNLFFKKKSTGQERKISVYKELCCRIEHGEDVEALCNVINYVNETYWDWPKAQRFFNSIHKLLYNQGTSWVVYIQNPLQFFMTLANFFKELKEQLDYKDKKMIELSEDMMNFCINYIENASDQVLKLNMFEKDAKEYCFLDYAFLVGNMAILEKEQIEGTLELLWNQGRHTLQTLEEFMRVDNLVYEVNKKFSMAIFSHNFDIQIEEGDRFQFDFAYTSNSVYLKVIAEIIWPIPLILCEFAFSERIVIQYINGTLEKDYFTGYLVNNPVLGLVHGYLRGCFFFSCLMKSLTLKGMSDKPNFVILFYNLFIGLNLVQFVVVPLFVDTIFWWGCNAQMLYVFVLATYCLYNALSLKGVGVILRIFFRMALVVLFFGIASYPVIAMVAYPIHTVFLEFSQGIEGAAFPDLNVFSDLYQGIMVCYEFTFGAVVLVRPYIEETWYTYSITFVMMMFSFFGNIMLANLLIAFLTSQFSQINSKAKYLTMNMQWGLIQVFGIKDLDTIFSLPYPLIIPALPVYALMLCRERRKGANNLLRKVVHFVNVFLPVFFFMNLKLLSLAFWRYITIFLHLLSRTFVSPINAIYSLVWVPGGIYLLGKLYLKDNYTMITVLLNFTLRGKDLPNYLLGDEARNELVKIFQKINNAAMHNLNRSVKQVTKRQFIMDIETLDITRALTQIVDTGFIGPFSQDQDEMKKTDSEKTEIDDIGHIKDIDEFYLQSEKLVLPFILRKYAIIEDGQEPILDMEFMRDKLKNRINVENVDKLIAFEKSTLERASRYFVQENDYTVEMGVSDVSSYTDKMEEKLKKLKAEIVRICKK